MTESATTTSPTIGLVANRAARGVRRYHLGADAFWRTVPERLTYLTSTLEELEQAVAALRAQGVDVIACLGGDGSLHRLVEAVLRHYDEGELPVLLPLAGGTMNGLTRALGTGGAPGRVFMAAREALSVSPPQYQAHRILAVTDRNAGRTHHGFSLAAGLVTRAFRHYYQHSEPGMYHAVRASLLPITAAVTGGAFYRDLRLVVMADGAAWLSQPPHTLLASVVANPVLWFTPFGSSSGDPLTFHLAATSMGPCQIAPRLWSLFRGRCRHPQVRVGDAHAATVTGDGGYVIDGDLYDSEQLDLSLTIGPSFRVLVTGQRRARS